MICKWNLPMNNALDLLIYFRAIEIYGNLRERSLRSIKNEINHVYFDTLDFIKQTKAKEIPLKIISIKNSSFKKKLFNTICDVALHRLHIFIH